MKRMDIPSVDQIDTVARDFMRIYRNRRIFAFSGELGSGKTTFIQALCRILRMRDVATSPSFALVNEYRSDSEIVVFHFDFYRIKTLEEVFDFGYEDYFFSGHFCMIEWPEKVEEILPVEAVRVHIETGAGERRILRIATQDTAPSGNRVLKSGKI